MKKDEPVTVQWTADPEGLTWTYKDRTEAATAIVGAMTLLLATAGKDNENLDGAQASHLFGELVRLDAINPDHVYLTPVKQLLDGVLANKVVADLNKSLAKALSTRGKVPASGHDTAKSKTPKGR